MRTGDWMRGCYYGAGVAGKVEHPLGSSEATDSQLVRFEAGAPQTIDRVVIREDQTDGQVRGEPSFLSSLFASDVPCVCPEPVLANERD